MRGMKLLVGVASLLIVAGLALQGCGSTAEVTHDSGQAGAAVPAAAPGTPTTLFPTATATMTATIPPPPSPRTSDPPVASGTGQIGSQAISPHLTPTAPGQPTFTEEDVRAFIAATGLDLIRVSTEGSYQIEQVTFLSYSQAKSQYGIAVGVPDDRPLCLVTVHGTFKLTGPPVPGQGSNVHTFTTMVLIFDGLTGNRLGEQGQP
jgi:hypothetical protein